MAAVRSSADQEIHPFAFVDYDEDDSEGEVRPLETTNEHQRLIQQALRSTTSANHHSLEQAMYPGQSDASTSSESVSPHTGFSRSFSMAHAQNYNPQFAEEQKYVSLKQDCAIRDTHRDWDRWGGGRSRPEASRFNVGNPNLMSGGFSWGRSADTARSHEPFPFPSVKDFGAYNMPRVQQPLYSATAAKTEPRPSVDGGQQSAMPALLTFAQENLELRAQIQSFSQEVVQLRAALKEQQAAAAREIVRTPFPPNAMMNSALPFRCCAMNLVRACAVVCVSEGGRTCSDCVALCSAGMSGRAGTGRWRSTKSSWRQCSGTASGTSRRSRPMSEREAPRRPRPTRRSTLPGWSARTRPEVSRPKPWTRKGPELRARTLPVRAAAAPRTARRMNAEEELEEALRG
mmetsp:Transcript_50379/g.101109  ORF Transcript_50379/g.101109 Transcript_50379/m.101109 type:complete len:402 (-) Transcript_50379:72-1277(-)